MTYDSNSFIQAYKQPEPHQGKVPQQAVETEGCHAPIAEDVQLCELCETVA